MLVVILLAKFIQPRALATAAFQANLNHVLLAAILIVPNIAIQVAKWHYLLKLANPSVPLLRAFNSLAVGYPLAFVTPGRLGEIGRALFVPELSQMKTFRLFILDKLTNLPIVLFAGLSGVLVLLEQTLPLPVVVVLFTLLGFVSVLSLAGIFSRSVVAFIGRSIKVHNFSRRNYSAILLLGTIFYLIYALQFLLLSFAFQKAHFGSVLPAISATFLVKTVAPISFSDLGIREGAAVFFFNKIGIAPAAAFNAAFLLFLINLGIPTLAGLPILLRERRQS